MLLAEFVKDFGIKKYFRTTNNIKYSLLSNYIQLVLEGEWVGRLDIPKDFSELYEISKYFSQLNTTTDSLRFGDVYIVLSSSRYRYGVFLDDETVIEQPNHLDPQHKIMKYNVEENTRALELRGYTVIWLRPLNEKNIFPPYMLGANSYVIPTVAAMKTINLPEGMIVTTNGYYRSDDGAGAKYLIVQGDHTDDGGYYHKLNNGNYAQLMIENNTVSCKVFGAKGDGIQDDTILINNAIAQINTLGGGTVTVPNGTYMIKSHIQGYVGNILFDQGGIELRDNVHLKMEVNALIKAIPNNMKQYVIVRIYNKKNVRVSGGQIIGDRDTHTGTGGEWGYGIAITGGSNIIIEDMYITDCWGDGINMQIIGFDATAVPKDVQIHNVTSDGNRRQGMSIEGADNILVTNSRFINTSGTAPAAGVDIEPWQRNVTNRRIRFEDCVFAGNQGLGMNAQGGLLNQLTINNCIFENNLYNNAQLQIYCTNNGNKITVTNSKFIAIPNANGLDMSLQGGYNYIIDGNSLVSGIGLVKGVADARIHDVIISNNIIKPPANDVPAVWIRTSFADNVTIKGNYLDGTNLDPTISSGGVGITDGSTNINVLDNNFLNVTTGVSTFEANNRHISIVGNLFNNLARYGVSVSAGKFIDILDNTFVGVSHKLSAGAIINHTGGTKVVVKRNKFIQGPILTTNGLGEFYATRCYSRTGDAIGIDTLITDNLIINDGVHNLDLVNYSLVQMTTGYVAELPSSIMRGVTAQRPTQPVTSQQFFNVTVNKMQYYNGTSWIDIG